jgi:hypothetical protein
VPRVVGLLAVRAGEREHVGRRHERDTAGPEDALEVREDRAGVVDVLDRLQEDDRVDRLGPGLHQVAREPQAGPRVLRAGVLVRLGVRVDARDARGALREHRRAVALAAGHVDDVEALHALGDPLVDRQMAAVPVVLLGHVRKGPLPGQAERGDAVRLIALRVLGNRLQGAANI